MEQSTDSQSMQMGHTANAGVSCDTTLHAVPHLHALSRRDVKLVGYTAPFPG